MATYAPVAYTTAANNTQIDFDITFTFLRNQDLAVSVIDPSGNVLVAGTGYDTQLQTQNDGTFDMRVVQAGTLTTTNTPLTAGHVISIKRATDISTILTVFQDGASFKAADINAIINQLFNNAQETAASVGEGIGLTDDLLAYDADNKPLRNLAAPTADTDAVRKIDVDSGIGADITTVAGIASDVTSVVADATDIGVVAANLSGSDTIGTVAGIAANVTSVANDAADIGVVATDLSGSDTIGTVAGIASAVSNVSSISSDVSTVAGVSSDVTTLAPQASNISTLTQTANLTALQNAETNAAAAEAALQSFNRTYLGAYTADPTTDGNGDPLTDGDLYYNSTANVLKFYDAGNSVWVTLTNSVQVNSASTLAGTGDVTFATGPHYQDFIMRDNSNPAQWVNVNPSTARTNLGLGTAATTDATAYATAAQGTTADSALQPNAAADFGSNAITYSNVYQNIGDLPSASTYHGMFAHVHATGKGYFAHAGNWVELANQTDVDDRASKGFAVAMSIVF